MDVTELNNLYYEARSWPCNYINKRNEVFAFSGYQEKFTDLAKKYKDVELVITRVGSEYDKGERLFHEAQMITMAEFKETELYTVFGNECLVQPNAEVPNLYIVDFEKCELLKVIKTHSKWLEGLTMVNGTFVRRA